MSHDRVRALSELRAAMACLGSAEDLVRRSKVMTKTKERILALIVTAKHSVGEAKQVVSDEE